jgi:hypothetical protein
MNIGDDTDFHARNPVNNDRSFLWSGRPRRGVKPQGEECEFE